MLRRLPLRSDAISQVWQYNVAMEQLLIGADNGQAFNHQRFTEVYAIYLVIIWTDLCYSFS